MRNAPELSPFAETLREPGFARLANDTLRWLKASSGVDVGAERERRVPALVTVASVYARLCAPAGASERAYDVLARFTLLFFLVDDAAVDEVPDLLAENEPWSIGRYTVALRTWLAETHELTAAPAGLRERFAQAYHDYLAARRAEHAHKSAPLGVDEHWAFRRRSIFMDPYLDLWLILDGVELAELAQEPFAAARALAVDLVLLANDLASGERDAQGGASADDLNLIHSYARAYDEAQPAALERLIRLHNTMVERYRAALARAIAARPGPHALSYAEILSGVVEGNVASVRALGFRYPGAEPVMQRLISAR
jgi:hypothetical protein